MKLASHRSAPVWLALAVAFSVVYAQTADTEASGPGAHADVIELPRVDVTAVREEIRELGEQWRLEPAALDTWREEVPEEAPGRIVWGFDSIHEMRRFEREWLAPEPHPGTGRVQPVTLLRIRR